jgi:hypothetical protein
LDAKANPAKFTSQRASHPDNRQRLLLLRTLGDLPNFPNSNCQITRPLAALFDVNSYPKRFGFGDYAAIAKSFRAVTDDPLTKQPSWCSFILRESECPEKLYQTIHFGEIVKESSNWFALQSPVGPSDTLRT